MAFQAKRLTEEQLKELSLQPLDSVPFPSEPVSSELSVRERRKGQAKWFSRLFEAPSEEERLKYRVILIQKVGESSSEAYFELHQSQSAEEAVGAFETLKTSLAPLLESGVIVLSEDLLSELILPSPKPITELPSALLKTGGSEAIKQYLGVKFDKQTLLHLSCEGGDHESVATLLRCGADVQATDVHTGNTALHVAATRSLQCLKHILLHAEQTLSRALHLEFLNRQNHNAHTSLHSACMHDNASAVEALVEAGAKLAIPAEKNSMSNPFHLAAELDHHACISAIGHKYEYLTPLPKEDPREMDKQKSINAPNAEGDTALLVAVRKQHVKSALALLLEGADPNCSNPNTLDTPLHIASHMGNITLVQLLLVFGASPTPSNAMGKTPLQEAKEADVPDAQKQQCVEAIEAVIKGCIEDQEASRDIEVGRSPPPTGDAVFLLSLDGGGSRGLILAQLLIALKERMKKLCPNCPHLSAYFDWVAGTSTGAFLALAFTHNKATPELCRKMYFKFKNKALKGHRVYPASDIDSSIMEAFGHSAVMADIDGPQVCVSTCLADRTPPDLHLMCNYGEARDNQLSPTERPIWEAARASSAAPTYFPAFQKKFLDGGVMANNPTLDSLAEIFSQAKKDNQMISVGCVISLGTGVIPPVPLEGVSVINPHNPAEFLRDIRALKDLAELFIDQSTCSDGQEVARAKAWCESMGTPYFRLSPPIDNVALNETDDTKLIKMLFDTLTYTYKERETIDQAARLLLRKKLV